jgi:hypothetical protein
LPLIRNPEWLIEIDLVLNLNERKRLARKRLAPHLTAVAVATEARQNR